jgi:hypothetical protein
MKGGLWVIFPLYEIVEVALAGQVNSFSSLIFGNF